MRHMRCGHPARADGKTTKRATTAGDVAIALMDRVSTRRLEWKGNATVEASNAAKPLHVQH
jgi:hypothetical protein